jgi:hypothetical protein
MSNHLINRNANKPVLHYDIFSASPLSKNKHEVVLATSFRPNNIFNFKDYYDEIVANFTESYHCVLLKVEDIRLNPFRDSALIFITVSTNKKKLEKAYRDKGLR